MALPILKVRNIRKKFKSHTVLKDITLELFSGETHLIIGENGAGKSTLMKIISGVYLPDDGEILWKGEPIEIPSPHYAHKIGITTIYQEPNLFPNLSITENLFIHKFQGKFLTKSMHKESRVLLNKFGMDVDVHTPVAKLGLAEKQMIEIIRAVIRQSKILIFDEATAALSDPEFDIIKKLIKEISAMGVGIFFVSQRLDYLYKLGDRVTVIRDGRLIETKSTGNISYKDIVKKVAGESYSERYPKINIKKGKEVLRVKNLANQNLLHDINFSICKKQIVGLYGTMGSGRTLLGKTLFGLLPFTKGNILINSKNIADYNHHKAIEHGLCYLPEDSKKLGLFSKLNIKENITITQLVRFLRYGFINEKKEEKVAREYIKELAIKPDNLKAKARILSGGNQQKLVLAKWFNLGAKLFILDEPTKGIDIASKSDVYNIINKLVLSGASILMISSDLNELVGMCDRILIMKNGTIVKKLTGQEATVKKILEVACN